MSLSREGTLCHRRLRLRAVSPASVGIRRFSPPDDHFTAGPDCRLTKSGSGRVGGAGGCPTIRARIVSAAGIKNALVVRASATPDDHFTASADCRVIGSRGRRVGGAGGCPTLRAAIVSPAIANSDEISIFPPPDDHFTAGPDCRVTVSRGRCVGGAGGRPTIRAGIVSPPCVHIVRAIKSAPDDHFHFTASQHCRRTISGSGRGGGAGGCPTFRAGIVSAAGVKNATVRASATPDDHFAATPDCRVSGSPSRCVVVTGGCPILRAGIVSTAGVENAAVRAIKSAPDDHFTAAPDCRVTFSASGRVGGAGGCPTVRAGIVSPAGVQIV